MHIVLESAPDGAVVATELDDALTAVARHELARADLAAWVAAREAVEPRWVWADTTRWYPGLVDRGLRLARAHDLRMCRRVLRHSPLVTGSSFTAAPKDAWDDPVPLRRDPVAEGLFDLETAPAEERMTDAVEEFRRQRAAVDAATDPGRLALLLAAESVGALIAVELHAAGVPWDVDRHRRILDELLGERPYPGARPARMEDRLTEVRAALDAPGLNPDSQPLLLKALRAAGLRVASTSKWELATIDHPAIAPLLEYKAMQRLLVANGWNWLDEWVHDARFRPVYVPSGVVTGRWASDGGGALQLPKAVRSAVVADPGWRLVVADAAQLEPRVLAAMSGDEAMARAGRAHDLYQGMVDVGAVPTREQAKYGILGAIYGGTTGESGRMRPRLQRAFPRAMAYVEEAARVGERGGQVATWLGRGSPVLERSGLDDGPTAPGEPADATDEEHRRRRQDRAAWGRFTRNFVVQGTAAEWALCWMGMLRSRLRELNARHGGADRRAVELVFFLHDELIVHSPAELAEEVAAALREAATAAGRLLFRSSPVEFPLTVSIVDDYGEAS